MMNCLVKALSGHPMAKLGRVSGQTPSSLTFTRRYLFKLKLFFLLAFNLMIDGSMLCGIDAGISVVLKALLC